MTQVTPHSIAYAVVQVQCIFVLLFCSTCSQDRIQARLTLSDKESWDKRDGSFNYQHFYESVVAVFENEPGLPWVEETLKWWNA